MKRMPVYLAVAAVALFWAADGRAANDPDDYLAGVLPYLHVPVSSRLPNSFFKLSGSLPLNEFDLSSALPKSFLHIAEELKHANLQILAEHLPNSFLKISTSLPERPDTDDVARFGLNRQVKLSDRLPESYLKIGSQYPTPSEH